MVTRVASNDSELQTALTASVGGDMIDIGAWTGGDVIATSRSYTGSHVTIRGGAAPTGAIRLTACQNVAVENVTNRIPMGGTPCSILDASSANIRIKDNDFGTAGMDSVSVWTDFGPRDVTSRVINVNDGCDGLEIINNRLGGARLGCRLVNITNATIAYNRTESIRDDTVKISGNTSNVDLIENLGPLLRWFPAPETVEGADDNDHADFIQVLGTANNYNILRNIVMPLLQIPFQAYFNSNGSISNVNTFQNITCQSSSRAISWVGEGNGQTGAVNQIVENNTTLHYGTGTVGAALFLTGEPSGISKARNFQGSKRTPFVGDTGADRYLCTGINGNVTAGTPLAPNFPWDVYQIAPGKQSAANMNFALTMDDLIPVPGGLADRDRAGATDTNTYGAFETIAKWHAGTWGHSSLQGGGGGPAPSARRGSFAPLGGGILLRPGGGAYIV